MLFILAAILSKNLNSDVFLLGIMTCWQYKNKKCNMFELFLPHSVYYLSKIKELHIMLPPVAIVNAIVDRVETSEN